MAALPNLLPVYDKFLEYLVEKATPGEILAFQVSEDERDYAQRLIERNNEGTITAEEAQYLAQIVEFDLLISVLKAKALKAAKQL